MASGRVSISQATISSCPESNRVHLMACEIEHDGEAQVASYFDTSVREEGTNPGVEHGEKGTLSLDKLVVGGRGGGEWGGGLG